MKTTTTQVAQAIVQANIATTIQGAAASLRQANHLREMGHVLENLDDDRRTARRADVLIGVADEIDRLIADLF